MKIQKERHLHNMSGRKLKRARYLYIWLIRNHIITGNDNIMDHFVERMMKAGLYSEKSGKRDVAFLIQRRLHRVYNPEKLSWYEWRAAYKWGKLKRYGQIWTNKGESDGR